MVAAPDHHVVADLYKRLDYVRFEDKAILTNVVCINMGMWVYKGYELIIPRLAFDITIAAKLVHPTVAEGSKKLDLIRRGKLREAIPLYQRQTGETFRF